MVDAARDYEMKILRKKLPQFQLKKKYIIAAAITLCFLGGGLYAFTSIQAWKTYEKSYADWYDSIRTDLTTAFTFSDATTDDKDKKLAAIKDVTSKMSNQGAVCVASVLIQWQQGMGDTKRYKEECVKKVEQVSQLSEKLTIAVTYLEEDHALSSLLVTTSDQAEKLVDSSWQTQLQKWSEAKKKLQERKVGKEFEPILVLAIEKVAHIENAWQALLAAHSEKNKTKYLDEQAQLHVAYEELKDIPVESKERFAAIASEANRALMAR